MNEQIQNLKDKIWTEEYWTNPNTDKLLPAQLNKFAELIVKECADLYTHDDVMAPVGQSAYGEAYQDGWIEGTKAYRETILEHFGVGE
ncbi:hypothetical protein UFOVP257_99 [uncultured Caudovirales phage]|uniref:Uncharacterized protein n=1 Tax=uncultured Caudovirales phage TaxID=2100421 RepID=A0A6J5LIX7_9CAUD|nr:hypothetical protein UFOVP257_99 [uncultured Caudovirales phage]